MKQILFILLFLYSTMSFTQKLQFYKEKLDFEISKDEFKLDGLYFFRNNSDDTLRQYLLYPFPQNPNLGEIIYVDGSSVYPKKDDDIIKSYNQKAAYFRLKVNPQDTAVTNIIYIQEIYNNEAEYVLTSTHVWKKPLEKAVFTLKVPLDIKIDSLAYKEDTILIKNDHLLYKWKFEDFLPNQNFYISFSQIK